MSLSGIAQWSHEYPIYSHLVVPAVVSLLLMGMYFSGNVFLQNLVAPTMESMPLFSAREFGALEILQNILLLCIILYSIRSLLATSSNAVKLFAAVLIAVGVFTFLEEIDYGAHFVEYLTGQHGNLDQQNWDRNWHNKTGPTGVQNVSYLKKAANIILLIGFVLGPLLVTKIRFPLIRLLVPSKWVISTVFLIVMLSLLAHWLDDQGYSIIAGTEGNLAKNISEFRELNMYFLFLLYVVNLYRQIVQDMGSEVLRSE
jgi:hypothetical protein